MDSGKSGFDEIYQQMLEIKSSLERLNTKDFDYFVLESNNKPIKIESKDAIPKLLAPLIKQSYSVPIGRLKLSKESLMLALEDYMPIPDEKWKEVAKLLHSNNIKIVELNAEEAKAHYEFQDNTFNFSRKSLENSKPVTAALNFAKLLKIEEEKELFKLLNNPETKNFAIKQLVISNLRLVVSIARKYLNSGFDLEELVQEGIFGLIKSINKFDYKLGNKFSTYATWWIRQVIGRAISEKSRVISIPLHVIEAINKLTKVEKNLILEEGGDLTIERLSNELRQQDPTFTVEKIRELKKLSSELISLDKLSLNHESFTFSSCIIDFDLVDPLEIAIEEEKKDLLQAFLKSSLDDDELTIINLYYGLEEFNGGKLNAQEIVDEKLLNSNNIGLLKNKNINLIINNMLENETTMKQEDWNREKARIERFIKKKLSQSLRKLKKPSKNRKYKTILGVGN